MGGKVGGSRARAQPSWRPTKQPPERMGSSAPPTAIVPATAPFTPPVQTGAGGGACHHLTLGSSLAHTCSHSVPSLASKSLSLPTPASETDLSLGLGLLETGSLPFLGCAMASGRTQPLVPDQSLPRAGGPACR